MTKLESFKLYVKKKYPNFWKIIVLIRFPTTPIPLGLWLLNFIVQRLFRINGSVPWMVNYTSRVMVPERIKIGKDVRNSFALSGSCYIQGINGVSIGDHTIFAPGVKIISANHDSNDLNCWLPADPIEIGRSCWIGANVVILPGVKLGDRCVIGAGSVVTKSFPDDSKVVGVPAKRVQ